MKPRLTTQDTPSNSTGFTLIEMLVVIAIIALLSSMIIPAINGAMSKAKKTAAMSNLRQLGVGIVTFAADNKGRFPNGGFQPVNWHNDLYPYVGNNRNIFRDPAGNHDYTTWTTFEEDGEFLPFDFAYNAHINPPSGNNLTGNFPRNQGPRSLSDVISHPVPMMHTVVSQNNFIHSNFNLPKDSGIRQAYDPRHGGRGIVLWTDSSISSPTYEEYMQMAKDRGGPQKFVTGRR